MLLTVSTVKDTLENVRFFVAANLASGVDHMVVFLDAPKDPGQPEVGEFLDALPAVTCVRTTRKGWWTDGRPASLNNRQRTNAGWVKAVLEPFDWAEWLFHVDGDEVACVDREALAAVPDTQGVVRLVPWEAVSSWDGPPRPTRFKRLLEDDDLNLLQVLGVIAEPTNQAYFHGHVMGKSGIRPRSPYFLTLHEAVTADGRRVAGHEDPRLKVLHYDAPSGEEFVRKWTALAKAGPARYRSSRAPAARALRSLASRDLPDDVRTTYLRRVYELTTRDDVDLLADLRLLGDADPGSLEPTARPLPADAADALAARVAEMSALAKAPFFVADPVAPAEKGARRWLKAGR